MKPFKAKKGGVHIRGPSVAVPNGWADRLIERRRRAVPKAFSDEFDATWCRIAYHLERTEGTEEHKQWLKGALCVTILYAVARGRKGFLGSMALMFDDWQSSFIDRQVSKWEIVKELAVNAALVALGQVQAKFNLEVTYEVPVDEDESGAG